MERIVITAQCDPYNAKNHWYGQEVLKYDGATPVKWIIGEYDSESQARRQLYTFAKNEPGFAEYDYDDALAYIRELERLEDIQFYANKFMENGEGIYVDGMYEFILPNDYSGNSYTYDTITYRVETI